MMKRTYLGILSVFLIGLVLVTSSSLVIGQENEEEEEEGLEEFVELTGDLNYILFGLAVLILPWKFLYKNMRKMSDRKSESGSFLRKLDKLAKWFHYIIGLGAVFVISYHAYMTMAEWNPLHMIGLVLIWAYLMTGILFYFKKLPGNIKGVFYKLHGSKIFILVTALILFLAHFLGD